MYPYLIVFGLLITGVLIWQLRQTKQRTFDLSKQIFPELDLKMLTRKKEGKVKEVIVRIHARKKIAVHQLKFELISPKREFLHISSSELVTSPVLPFHIEHKQEYDIIFPYEQLKEAIEKKMPNLNSFRTIIKLDNGKVFKSHELRFSKYWKIYKADTGTYN